MIKNDVIRARFPRAEAAELYTVSARTEIAAWTHTQVLNNDVVNAVIIAGDDTLDRDSGARGGLAAPRTRSEIRRFSNGLSNGR